MTRTATALSLISTGLQLLLLTILMRRKLQREFSFFVIYIAASVLIAFARLSFHKNPFAYFYIYWATEAIYAILGLLVLHQVFRRVFRDFYSYWRWFWLVFPLSACMMAVIAVWYGIKYAPNPPYVMARVILISEIAVNFMRGGLFALFFVLVRFFALRWRNYAFAIILGFAVSAMGSLSFYWLYSEFKAHLNLLLGYIVPISYLCAVLLWLAVFNRPEPETKWALEVTPEELLQELKEYGKILTAIRRR